ncbi:MAG TPA: hypothetical protein EYQ31_09150, partial [Candidatus Handelsmanbacteria bacterium]|nr:hypothetical protein [Candidatus Handelsmanbacteria bacterium]
MGELHFDVTELGMHGLDRACQHASFNVVIADAKTGGFRQHNVGYTLHLAGIDEDTEYYSLVRALKSVDTSDVALLVIDATIGVTHQDQRLAERVDAAGCPIVVLLNKWDLCDTEQRE